LFDDAKLERHYGLLKIGASNQPAEPENTNNKSRPDPAQKLFWCSNYCKVET
jgi:hypothetical protein